MSEEEEPDRKPKVEPFPPLVSKSATTPVTDEKPQPPVDIKPRIAEDVKPPLPMDVKPQILEDVKPTIAVDAKPVIKVEMSSLVHEEEEEGEEDSYEDDGVVAPYSFPVSARPAFDALEDIKPPAAELQRVKQEPVDEEEGEEDDYEEDDFLMAPRIAPVLNELRVVKPEVAVAGKVKEEEEEEEEEYEEEDWVEGTWKAA